MSRYRPEFVMARVDVIEACEGDANLAVLHAYIDFRLRDFAADQKRAKPSSDYRKDADGGVWVRCTTGEMGAALGQNARTLPRRLDRLAELHLIEREDDGRARWYRADCAQAAVESRADCAPTDESRAQIARESRADCAPTADLSYLSKKGEEPKDEEPASASPDADPGTDLVVAVGEVHERRRDVPNDARGIVNAAWEKRKADRGTTPVLAGGYTALLGIVRSLLKGGNDPRIIALAIYHNDGAWTLAAMNEQMRQIRVRAEGPTSRGDSPSEVLARVARLKVAR